MVEHINGWLNVYKQKGISSFFISKALKKKLKIKKIGHLGTLDPLAEGVLPIAIGEATKSIAFIKNNNKRYSFKIKWGEEKDTCDEEGKTVYKSKRLKNIPLKNDDIYVATQTGDRLDLLSNQYYGSPTYWWIIANANNIHDGKLGLKDGTILRIPKDYTEIIRKESNE